MKKFISLTASLTLALTLLLTLASCGTRYTMIYDDADKYSVGDATLNGDIRELEIEWVEGKISISYHDGDGIIIEEDTNRKTEEQEKLHYYLDGGELHIKYAKSGTWSFGMLSKDLSVKLPSAVSLDGIEIDTASADTELEKLNAGELDIDSASGAVLIDGGSYNDISMDSASGRLTIEHAAVRESIEANTASGNVKAELSSAVKSVNIDTVSGDVLLNTGRCDELDISTTSGKAELDILHLGKESEISSVSGNIKLKTKYNADLSVKFDTVSGNFDSEIAMTKENGVYTAGNGDCEIEVRTTSGNFRIIKETDIDGE